MASREPATGPGPSRAFDPSVGTTLSWALGRRIIGDEESTRLFERREGRRTLTAYAVTDHTCVVAVRSPVGREKFYEVSRDALSGLR